MSAVHEHDAACAHGPADNHQLPAQPQESLVDRAGESRFYRFLVALWTKPSWLAPLAILGCFVASAAYVLTNDPTDTQRDPLGPCAFKLVTGLDCPGCGGTRMFYYLLHGNIPEAARHHFVAFIAVPFVVWGYIAWAAKRLFNVTLPTKRISMVVVGFYLVGWLAFSVIRNLPWAPFTYLWV